MKKIFIFGGTCELRFLDAKKICYYLSENDYEIVCKPKDADIIIFITCATLDDLVEYSFNKIKEFKKYDAELIVAGCLPAMEKKRLSKIFGGKTIITKDFDKIDCFFPGNKIEFACIDDANILFQNYSEYTLMGVIKKILRKIKWIENVYIRIEGCMLKNLFDEHSCITRYLTKKSLFHIRISWGCSGNCSYCGIKKAIGSFKSKPIDQCITEFGKGLNQGYKHFVINADDTGAYGKDIGSSFPVLLDKITKIPDKYEISIRNLHPKWVIKYIDDLEEIIKRCRIISVDIPLQSMSRRILKLMNRCSDIEKIKDAFLRLHALCPDLSINTEFIFGFPTETEEEFKQTLDFVKESDFSRVGLYPFSCKDDTEAENIEPKIPQEEIFRRLKYAKKFMKNIGYSKLFLPKFHNVMMFYNKK